MTSLDLREHREHTPTCRCYPEQGKRNRIFQECTPAGGSARRPTGSRTGNRQVHNKSHSGAAMKRGCSLEWERRESFSQTALRTKGSVPHFPPCKKRPRATEERRFRGHVRKDS